MPSIGGWRNCFVWDSTSLSIFLLWKSKAWLIGLFITSCVCVCVSVCVCVWFNDSLSNSDYIASSGRAVVSNELERTGIPFFWNMTLCPRRSYRYLMNTILSTDRMVSAARKATHDLAQDLATNDSLLLLILKAMPYYTHSNCCMFSICVQWWNSLSLLPVVAQ